MSITGSQAETSEETFTSHNPATGEVVARFPIHSKDEVDAAVARARVAFGWWQGLGYHGRKQRLQAWKGIMARRGMQLADLVHQENGKPVGDAFLEIMLTINHLDWSSKKAQKVLGPHRVSPGLLGANLAASVEYPAMGVVGVIGPWNYPVFTPMGSIAYALAAGNAVVFKPSEYTPAVGKWLVDTFAQAVPEHPVLQLVTGFGETGNALCVAEINKLAFTGSSATGRKVAGACAQNLTPVLMECGGKDAMIVADDANVAAAADAALWGGMSNAGQTCIGTERVYVVDSVYDEFLAELTRKASALRPGDDADASYGPITMPSQLDVIKRHITEALAAGGRAVVGGADAVDSRYVQPTVLVDVPESCSAVQEETFGPTLTVTRVATIDEAVAKANGTSYGLASSVFSKSRGMEIARRIHAGMTAVNTVIAFASVPALPFGGIGESGYGRIHGEDGLKEFTSAKAIARQRFALPVPLLSFERPQKMTGVLAKVTSVLHGRS